MLKKKLKAVTAVVLCYACAAVADDVLPNAVTMFFLPSSNLADVTSLQETKAYRLKKVVEKDGAGEKSSDAQKKTGIDTPVGLSLIDIKNKGAAKNTTFPAKVLIFPPKDRQKTKGPSKKGQETRAAYTVQISKFPDLKKMAEAVAEKNKPDETETPKKEKKPSSMSCSAAVKALSSCDGPIDEALTVLADALSSDLLPLTVPECSVYEAVAAYLRKCHPYPVVYYTPTNAAVARRISVQKAVDLLTSHYRQKKCSYLDLSHVNFEKAEFYRSSLTGIDFSDSFFAFATFMDGKFSNGIFKNAVFDNVLIQNADFSGGFFKNARLTNSHVLKTDMAKSNFVGATLTNTQWRHVKLKAVDMTGAKAANTRFAHVDADRMTAKRADFTDSVMTGTLWSNGSAEDANFSSLVCDKCFFERAKLPGAQFYKASFTQTSFARADLNGVNFENAVFHDEPKMKDADLYAANFKGVEMTPVEKIPVEKLRLTTIDRRTVPPTDIPDFDSVFYDEQIALADRKRPDFAPWHCPQSVCEDRLAGRASNNNLTVRAMTILENVKAAEDDKAWAVCTMSCLAQTDKSLTPSQTDLLAAYIRRQRPWSPDDIKASSPWGELDNPLKPEEQQILYTLMSLSSKNDLGYDIDLTRTDLRGADLSYADLSHLNFAGANLSMADMGGSTVRQPFRQFDGIVFDEYTVFPEPMTSFTPHPKPVRIFPKEWPPETVEVIRMRLLPPAATPTEHIPYPPSAEKPN